MDRAHVTVVEHPLVQHKLTLMRKVETSTNNFRRLLSAHPELVHITVEVNVVATGGQPAVTH